MKAPALRPLLQLTLWIALALPATPGIAAATVVVVGIDGASWNLIAPLCAAGELPNITRILESGSSALLEAHEPVNSPSVWTTLATGRRPRHHGVTDFHATRLAIRVPTVFERLAQSGMRVGLYDYLVTWPPERLEGGFVVPGWLRHDGSTFPADVWARAGGEPYVMSYEEEVSVDGVRRRSLEETRRKASAFNRLAEAFSVDVGVVTFYALDNVAHRFWRAAFPEEFPKSPPPEPPYTQAQQSSIRDVLHGIDRSLGEIDARLGDEDTLLIVSDHGFERSPEGVDDIWIPSVDALLEEAGLEPERDHFNVVTDFGVLIFYVHEGDLDQRDQALDRLLALVESIRSVDGKPLFSTDFVDLADRPRGKKRSLMRRLRQWTIKIVAGTIFHINTDRRGHAYIFARPREKEIRKLWPAGQVSVAGATRPVGEVFQRDEFTGDHQPDGILIARGPAIASPAGGSFALPPSTRLSALDVAPLLFYLTGSAIPDDLEGRLPRKLLREAYLAQHPPESIAASELASPGASPEAATPREDPELVEMLRRLGYVR